MVVDDFDAATSKNEVTLMVTGVDIAPSSNPNYAVGENMILWKNEELCEAH